MRFLSLPAALVVAATPAFAQLTHVIPNGTATAPGNSSNAFPWGTNASAWGGLRLMAVYDSTNFTAAAITFPVVIQRLRWRVNDSTQTWTGGSFANATVSLSTAAVDFSAATTAFASNHGPDLTTVFNGPVTIAPGASNGAGVLPPWVVDIPLTTPFVYDPALGDLNIDVDYPGGSNWSGGTVPGQMDVQSTGSNACRVFASSMYPAANGVTQNHGPVVEITYVPTTGYGYYSPFGQGCGGGGAPGIYESFDGATSTNDLANSGIQLQPVPQAYVAIQGASAIVPGVGATLALADNATLQVPLPWSLPHATGSTSSLWVCSNGWIALEATTLTDQSPSVPELRFGPARVALFWTDLDPTLGGAVTAGVDPTNPTLFHVTWTGVPTAGATATNTMQATFSQGGSIELKWGAMAAVSGLAGYHPGNGGGDPGATDLSAIGAVILGDGRLPLALLAQPQSRPVLGQTFTSQIREIPPNATLGALVLGVAQFDPGVNLAAAGMNGCFQHASVDAVFGIVPSGPTLAVPLQIPNAPSFAGTSIYSQAAVLATGFNALGIITSNGGVWNLDLQ